MAWSSFQIDCISGRSSNKHPKGLGKVKSTQIESLHHSADATYYSFWEIYLTWSRQDSLLGSEQPDFFLKNNYFINTQIVYSSSKQKEQPKYDFILPKLFKLCSQSLHKTNPQIWEDIGRHRGHNFQKFAHYAVSP